MTTVPDSYDIVMSKRYEFKFPVTRDMSPITIVGVENGSETASENAMWHYNDARAHDGLRPVQWLPRGTEIKRLTDV